MHTFFLIEFLYETGTPSPTRHHRLSPDTVYCIYPTYEYVRGTLVKKLRTTFAFLSRLYNSSSMTYIDALELQTIAGFTRTHHWNA